MPGQEDNTASDWELSSGVGERMLYWSYGDTKFIRETIYQCLA